MTSPGDRPARTEATEPKDTATIDDAVRTYLRANPALLRDDPVLLSELLSSPRDQGPDVVDLQSYVMRTLRAELADMKEEVEHQEAAITAERAEALKLQDALLTLLDARDFEDLLSILCNRLPVILKVRSIIIGLEGQGPTDLADFQVNVQIVEPGEVGRLLDTDDVRFVGRDIGVSLGFAPRAGHRASKLALNGSLALLRIDLGDGAPACLVALNAKDPDRFSPDSPREPYAFFAACLGQMIRQWLAVPHRSAAG
ncbi:MAG: DUF484 family protein [Pseudomonadota bacterium]